MKWYIEALRKYAVFSGRSSRQAYWMFVLMALISGFIIGLVAGVIQAITDTDASVLINTYTLALFIPSISIAVRRMHDSDHSGWWSIVPIAGLVFLFYSSTKGPNRFGPELSTPASQDKSFIST